MKSKLAFSLFLLAACQDSPDSPYDYSTPSRTTTPARVSSSADSNPKTSSSGVKANASSSNSSSSNASSSGSGTASGSAASPSASANGDAAAAACSSKERYLVHKGASITWRVTKLTGDIKEESIVTGTTGVEGELAVPANDWTKAKASFKLTGKNTESGNALRDTRIDDLIFGLSAFKFEVTGIEADIPSRTTLGSKVVTVLGKLSIAGAEAKIRLPALLNETEELIAITPNVDFKMNLRGDATKDNSLNIASPLSKLFALVPGVNIKDDVSIDFNLELFPYCPAPTGTAATPSTSGSASPSTSTSTSTSSSSSSNSATRRSMISHENAQMMDDEEQDVDADRDANVDAGSESEYAGELDSENQG